MTDLFTPTKEDFEKFWKSYPRRIAKKAAFKAWQRARDMPPLIKIIGAIEKQKQSEQWQKNGGQFIPHPATWLNQGRWDDELPEGDIELPPDGCNRMPRR